MGLYYTQRDTYLPCFRFRTTLISIDNMNWYQRKRTEKYHCLSYLTTISIYCIVIMANSTKPPGFLLWYFWYLCIVIIHGCLYLFEIVTDYLMFIDYHHIMQVNINVVYTFEYICNKSLFSKQLLFASPSSFDLFMLLCVGCMWLSIIQSLGYIFCIYNGHLSITMVTHTHILRRPCFTSKETEIIGPNLFYAKFHQLI